MNGGADIAFLSPGDSPLFSYSLDAFEKCPEIDGIVLVVNKEKVETVANMVRLFGCSKLKKIVGGTAQRTSSLLAALKVLDVDVSIVSIHDVSRPCVTAELISETVKAAKRYGSGVAAVKVEDAIKEVEKGQKVSRTMERGKLWASQTPQTFKRETLEKALESSIVKKKQHDDDAQMLSVIKKEVHLVPSSSRNMKVRNVDDLVLASALLRVK